jgi:aminopeptidase N
MAQKPIEAWHPDWHLENDAAASAQQIISTDSLEAARAIHGNPKTPAEIKEMFDGITYAKGGAVLRMLESYVGPEIFRKSVNAYLQAHANGNATSADFWETVAHISGKPIEKIMPTFVMQPGVPMLNVKTSCVGGHMEIGIDQQRFFLSPEKLKSPSRELWQIPVCLMTAGNSNGQCIVIDDKTVSVSQPGCPEWIFANRNAEGYFRVAYPPDALRAITRVAETKLNGPERIALIEDTWAMTRAGKTSAAAFLDLAQSLRGEQQSSILDLLARHLDYVGDSLVAPEKAGKYRTLFGEQFAPLARNLGF